MAITKRISKQQVKHIAKLARISLSKEDVELFQKQLGDIIEYFNLLSEVDTEGVEEVSQVTGLENVVRKDEVKDFLSQKHALSNAPETEDGFFKTISPFKQTP